MRLLALESSDSRELPYILRKEKKLRYNAEDGSNNLVEWIPVVIQMSKAAQPAFHKVLVDRAIPQNGKPHFQPLIPLYTQPSTIISAIAQKMIANNMKNKGKTGKFASLFFVLGISDSSEKRVKE